MEIARDICRRVLDKYGDSILAVFIYASTGKKLDRPYSDLEIGVVCRDKTDIPDLFYVYRGLLVEIDYLQETSFLKGAGKITADWPIQADQYRNRTVLFERDKWTLKLDQAAKEGDQSDFSEAVRNATIGMLESLASFRNARITRDILDLKSRGLYLVADAARVVYLLNRRYVLTTSWFWKQLLECPLKPPNLEDLVRTVAGFDDASIDEREESAERLCSSILEMVESRGISVESDDLLV